MHLTDLKGKNIYIVDICRQMWASRLAHKAVEMKWTHRHFLSPCYAVNSNFASFESLSLDQLIALSLLKLWPTRQYSDDIAIRRRFVNNLLTRCAKTNPNNTGRTNTRQETGCLHDHLWNLTLNLRASRNLEGDCKFSCLPWKDCTQNTLSVPKPKVWCPNLPQVIKAS